MNVVLKIIAIVLLMYGAAMGLGKVLWGELWLGCVLTGGALFAGVWINSICAAAKRKSDLSHVHTLLDALNISLLTQKYPLHAAGIAGAIGFMLAGGKAAPTAPLYTMVLQMTEEIVRASLVQLQNNVQQQQAT